MSVYHLISLAGIPVLLACAWLLSPQKRVINWRVIFWGITIQFIFALVIFIIPGGSKIFLLVNNLVISVLNSASEGSRFVFGRLALPPGTTDGGPEGSLGFFLAFQALPGIIFFGALVSLLYHIGVMPALIRGFARLFTGLMRVSGAEALCASANIFVGVESTLAVKPHLEKMTHSELMVVLTAGMATVASNVLAMYVFMLHNTFPTIAGHLVSASVLSAPAAIIMAKLIMPETNRPETLGKTLRPVYQKDDSFLVAIINGANGAVKLVVGIGAMLIAFLGLVALLDLFLSQGGGLINRLLGIHFDWSIRSLLQYVFYPFTLVLGIPPEDAAPIARLIGERVVVTEVAAYKDLALLLEQGVLHHTRSAVICTYALCGFAHVASLAIFTGGLTALLPGRTREVASLGPRALVAATLACLQTACVAGIFFSDNSILTLG